MRFPRSGGGEFTSMSGICGIFNFDGSPLQKELLVKMTAASGYRGPDGTTFWVKGNAGLAYQAFHTTPEAVLEKQPLLSPHDDLVLAMDARIDNREELIRILTAKNQLLCEHPTDADLVLAAYEVWEGDCPKQLVGDFAFIIWDMGQRRLFAARDPIGIRQLYYCQKGQTLIISSAVGSILAVLQETPAINTTLLQNMLSGNFDRWVNETGYQNIFRIPPSYSLTVEAGFIKLNRYWVLGEMSAPSFKDENEYAECYKDLFFQSVQAQLRTINPPAIMGGAGVDSGAIACTADQLIKLGKAASPIYTYLATFDRIPEADEGEYLQYVSDHCHYTIPKLINCDDCWALQEFPEDFNYPYDDLDITNADRAMVLKILRSAYQEGCRVMLTGLWGDQMNGQAAYRVPGFMRDVPLFRLYKEFPYFLNYSPLPTWQTLGRAFLAPFLPQATRQRLANLIYRQTIVLDHNPKDNRPTNLLPASRHLSPSGKHIYQSFSNGIANARLSAYDRLSAYSQIDLRYPYLDRRLVDYMLSIPGRLLFRDGTSRHLQRQAMLGIMPETIRNRSSKACFTQLYETGLKEKEIQKIQSMMNNSQLVVNGLLSEHQLKSVWGRSRDDEKFDTRFMLWLLSIEIWMNQRYINPS